MHVIIVANLYITMVQLMVRSYWKKNNINRTPSFGQHKPQVRMNFVTHLPMVTSLNLDIFFRISDISHCRTPSFFGTAGTLGVSWTRFPPVPLVPLDMSANSGLPGHIGDLLRIEGNFQQLLPIFVGKPVKSNDMKKKTGWTSTTGW